MDDNMEQIEQCANNARRLALRSVNVGMKLKERYRAMHGAVERVLGIYNVSPEWVEEINEYVALLRSSVDEYVEVLLEIGENQKIISEAFCEYIESDIEVIDGLRERIERVEEKRRGIFSWLG